MAEAIKTPPGAEVVLPPHGFVALRRSMASDLDVVNAARVSFAKESDWTHIEGADRAKLKLREDDERVLRYLLKGKHGTPFEHNFMQFHVRAPIHVFREWHRHRIGVSINEESARYVQLRSEGWVPEGKEVRRRVGRPGRYAYEPVSEAQATVVSRLINGTYQDCFDAYEAMLNDGIAPEVARVVLPVGTYSQMLWSCNARSLMAFLALRAHPAAMREIRIYAEAMERIFAETMPVTHDAFVENGRVAP